MTLNCRTDQNKHLEYENYHFHFGAQQIFMHHKFAFLNTWSKE